MHLLLQSCATRCTEFLSKRAISPRRILSWVNRDYVKETLGGFLLLYLPLLPPAPPFLSLFAINSILLSRTDFSSPRKDSRHFRSDIASDMHCPIVTCSYPFPPFN